MAGSFSDYAENKIVDHLTGKTSFTKPTAYIALFTAAPTDAGGGTEVAGSNYARVATAASDWNAASGGAATNAADITFPTPSGSWGTVTHFAAFDASTVGNMLWWGDLATSKSPGSGDPVKFPAGQLTVSTT